MNSHHLFSAQSHDMFVFVYYTPHTRRRPPPPRVQPADMILVFTATWSTPQLLSVTNSPGEHYTGGGLNHGIQLRNGPHKGRLAMARRFDCRPAGAGTKEYMRSYVLFSDNGSDWHAGELLPEGWTECQVAEMGNGSLLMTSRLEHTFPKWQPFPSNTTWPNPDRQNKRRAFARSDGKPYKSDLQHI